MIDFLALTISPVGLRDLLEDEWIPICLLVVAGIAVLYSKRRDWSGAVTVVGIALLGITLVGVAGNAVGVGDAILGLVVKD